MSDQRDEGYEFAPADTDPMTADEELELEDALADEPFAGVEVVASPPPPLGRTPAYDFIGHSFVPFSSGGALMLYGLDTLRQWVEKCLRTHRGESPACDPDFGVERTPDDLIDGGQVDDGELAAAQADWTESLMRHPRVSNVQDWQFEVGDDGEAAQISVTVTPEAVGQEAPIDPLDVTFMTGGANG